MTDILDATPEGQIEMVYLGTATGSDGKARALWIMADTFDALEPAAYNAAREAALWYPKKPDTARTIGGRYHLKADMTEEGKPGAVYFGSARYIGQSGHPLVAAFQADDSRARDADYRRKNEAKAKEPVYMRDLARTLETLRALPKRQALDIADAIHIELRKQILSK